MPVSFISRQKPQSDRARKRPVRAAASPVGSALKPIASPAGGAHPCLLYKRRAKSPKRLICREIRCESADRTRFRRPELPPKSSLDAQNCQCVGQSDKASFSFWASSILVEASPQKARTRSFASLSSRPPSPPQRTQDSCGQRREGRGSLSQQHTRGSVDSRNLSFCSEFCAECFAGPLECPRLNHRLASFLPRATRSNWPAPPRGWHFFK
jgi:hypothetical protein